MTVSSLRAKAEHEGSRLVRGATGVVFSQSQFTSVSWKAPGNWSVEESGVVLSQITNTLTTKIVDAQTNSVSFTYDSSNRVVSATDAIGQVTTLSYELTNDLYKITKVTDPFGRYARFSYDSNGYLTNIVGAVSGAVTTFTYDGYGRVRTTTDSEGYTLTYDYDALDRPTVVTYPDGTYDQIVYDRLDAIKRRDRSGRWTRTWHDALQRVVAVRDPAGRITQFDWCTRGSLHALIDALGQRTSWSYDLQGRVTAKTYADGTGLTYTYENTTSRLKSVKDAKNQYTNYQYLKDNSLSSISYSNAVIATPSVSFTYDANYNRVATMIDGTGTNTYSYNAVNETVGAGKLASLDGPLSSDTISYGYDELGRVLSRAIGSATNAVTYDALGRVTRVTNPLGTFTNNYVSATHRLSAVIYPNGQTANYTYYGNTNDQRLSEIKHLNATNGVISKFNYAYNVVGQITNWTQQVDSTTTNAYRLGYDAADQLTSATLSTLDSPPSTLRRYVYTYDKAGNRLSEQIDTNVTTSTHNNLNQLTGQSGWAGPVRFKGSVSEPATVTITNTGPAVAATVASNGSFEASVPLTQGTNIASVIAEDYSGNRATNRYQVVVGAGGDRVLTYDANGNLSSISNLLTSSVVSYEWDAANRLVAMQRTATNRTEFSYDGLSRRTKVAEINSGTTNTVRLLWCGGEICEERDATGATVNKRYLGAGVQVSTNAYFYAWDHLGSIREMTDATGAIRVRYDYDAYGRRTKVSGDLDSDFGFTGHYYHGPSGLHLAWYRAYDAELGRWLRRDLLGESAGVNLYAYVDNRPINSVDIFGLLGIARDTDLSLEPALRDIYGHPCEEA